MKLKPKTSMSVRQRACDDVFESVIEKFEENSKYVARQFVGRQEVIELIYTAFLLGKHVMLEGPPGVAKSQLAKAVFDTIKDSSTFYTMMMPNTAPENLFGPIDMRAFRERSEIRYNTKGMLPTSDFAFIDEVYRGPDSVLGTMLNMLNERIFTNGSTVVKCPLISAIGTTNFQSDSPLVEAFKDRWLFHFIVQPLSDRADRLALIKLADEGFGVTEAPPPLTVLDVRRFNNHLRYVRLTEEQQELYDELVTNFYVKCAAESATSGCLRACSRRISDRRLVDGVNVLKLGKILDDFGTREDETSEVSMFAVLKFVLCKGTKAQYDIFDEVCTKIVGGSATRAKEKNDLVLFTSVVDSLVKKYDKLLPRAKKADLLAKVNRALNPKSNDPDEANEGEEDDIEMTFTDPTMAREYDVSRARLKELQLELTEELNKPV